MSSLPLVGIVFSRDRAMQLDAMLHSLMQHCSDYQQARYFVIYQATSPQHARQYSFLVSQYAQTKNIQFIAQRDFQVDFYRCIMPTQKGDPASPIWGRVLAMGWKSPIFSRILPEDRFLLFLVDDNIFVSDFSFEAILHTLCQNERAIGFSLRLGLNTTHCYTEDATQEISNYYYPEDRIIEYEWKDAEGDFNYPLEVSSSIYRARDLFALLAELNFDNPNMLESLLAQNIQRFSGLRPNLLCFDRSVTFCNPINKVQTIFDNRAGANAEYSCEALANLFDDGYRIDVDTYSGFVPQACHQEVGLILTQSKSEYQ